MKRLADVANAVFGLITLGGLVAALVFAFSHLSPSQIIAISTNSFSLEALTQQPYPPPVMSPTPRIWGTPHLEATITAIAPTSIPNTGVHITTPHLITIPSSVNRLSFVDLDGNNLVARAELDKGAAIILVNIESGQFVWLRDEGTTGAILPHVSGNQAVWIDPAKDSNLYAIQLYSLETGKISEFYTIPYYQTFDFDNGIAIFSDYRNGHWGLYAYHSQKSFETSVAQGNLGCSRIEYPWVTYLEADFLKDGRPATVAHLRAFNIESNETLTLGSVFSPSDSRSCDFYALSANRVSWLMPTEIPVAVAEQFSMTDTPQDPSLGLTHSFYEVHIYDLHDKTTYVANVPVEQPSPILLSGDLLAAGAVGFDLTRDVLFTLPSGQFGDARGLPRLLSDDRLVWVMNPMPGEPQRIYVSSIIR